MQVDTPSPQASPVFSASQVATYLDCQRKWAFRYIAKIVPPAHPSAALGTEVHSQLEAYLRDGRPFDFTRESGYIAAAGMEHLPAPKTPGLQVEYAFTLRSAKGWTWRGYKDLRFMGADGVPNVWDHKTSSNIAQWAKSEETLAHDPQAILYAVDEFVQRPDAQVVDLKWLYYQTRGAKKSKLVHLRVTREHAEKVFSEMEFLAGEMATSLLSVSADRVTDLRPSPEACEAYGGCPYRHLCNLSPMQRMKAIMSQSGTNSLLARLKSRSEAPAATVPDTIPAPPPDPVPETALPAWATAPVDPLKEKLAKGYAPDWAKQPNGVPEAAPAVVAPAINPPEFQPAPTAEEREAAKAETAPKKRGRPAKVQTEIVTYSPPVEQPARVESISQDLAKAVDAVMPNNCVVGMTAERSRKIPVLYVDCVPLGGQCAMVEDVFAKVRTRILEEKGLADYRFAEYGTGPGIFSSVFFAMIDEIAPSVPVVIDSHTPEGAIVLSGLISRAALVVRGTR